MSIRWKLIVGALSFLLLVVGVFVAMAVVTSSQKDDGLVINLAGRQRLLAEKMTKEILAYADEPTEETWAAFDASREVFALTQRALLEGGPAPTTLDPSPDAPRTAVPPARDESIRDKLQDVGETFEALLIAAAKVQTEARSAKQEGDAVVAQVPVVQDAVNGALQQAQRAASEDDVAPERRAAWNQAIKLLTRQALLTERLGALALDYLRDPTEATSLRLENVATAFEETHQSLKKGGSVLLDLGDPSSGVMIAAVRDPRVQARLLDVDDAWLRLQRALRGVQDAAVARAAAIREVLGRSPPILAAMRTVADRAQVLSEEKVAAIQTVHIVALLAGILLVCIAALFGNRIGRHVGHAVDVARTIADGDLTCRSRMRGRAETQELLGSLDEMAEQLGALVRQVQLAGLSVGACSSQIGASAKRQEASVGELSSTTTEIAATSTQIAATAGELLDTMNAVGGVSEETARAAANSKRGLDDMERTMAHMVESTQAVQERLATISEKTAKISSVVTTIMKIAQQTNLISLNAAIEAENAGELGLGFAVVAKEVRRLADQTSKASQGIEKMVGEMQSAVSTAVMGMDGFADDIRTGCDAVGAVSAHLGGIISQVEDLAPQFESVREGMGAQATGADQIAEGVRGIVEASEETAASVQQTNAAIAQLTRAAEELEAGVTRFRVGEGGNA